MPDPIPPEFERNLGFWSAAEQEALSNARVALAGVGGDGYLLGLSLARMGISRFSVADPEDFERQNMNRVPGARMSTLGRPKVDCFVEDLLDIQPDAQIEVYPTGVSAANVEGFMHGADLVVDETELTRLELGAMIADEARRIGLPVVVVMNIGFAAQVTSYDPAGPGFREMMGIGIDESLDEIAQRTVDFGRCVPYIAPYTDIDVLRAVQAGAPLPSIVSGVNLASALGASQCFLHLTKGIDDSRASPILYPRVLYLDSMTGESRVVRSVGWSYRRSVLRMTLSRALGKTPRMSYPPQS